MRPHTPVGMDFEFYEDGIRIDLISVGFARPDGQNYYAVNADMPVGKVVCRPWLKDNVWPLLPLDDDGFLDLDHPDVKPFNQIAEEVKDFLQAVPDLLLVADYGAYDKVRLNQLWGPMANGPKGIPWWAYDLQQLLFELEENRGDIELPEQTTPEHHALNDAQWSLETYYWLREQERRIRGR